MIVPPSPPNMPPSGPQIYAEMLSEKDQKVLHRLNTDFRYFAARCLWIKEKEGNLVRFVFNDAQEYFHKRVEDMLQRIGYVRIICVKGRQQGMSTYIVGRLFWIAVTRSAKTVCIISHDQPSTVRLFEKVALYQRRLPEVVKMKASEDNKYALKFPNESEFFCVTAGSTDAGRGSTSQYRHESERASFKKPKEVSAGIGQSTADVPGTEVYRESTGKGFNHFQKEYTNAKAGLGKYEAVFIPWYWQKEYATPVRDSAAFALDDMEQKISKIYGLSHEQLQWRRDKIADDFEGDEKIFRQEYPLNDVEAFQASGDSFFDGDDVVAAMKSKIRGNGPIVIGVDPAGSGDRTVIAIRQGREFINIIVYKTMTGPRLVGILANLIDEYQAVKCFIDYGYGHDVIDSLRDKQYSKIVEGIYFQQQADSVDRFANKRAEMIFRLRRWLKDGEVSIPDDGDIAQDLAAIPDAEVVNGKFKFPDKKQIKKDFGRSPDICDAMMLTFAYPVKAKDVDEAEHTHTANSKNGSTVKAFSRFRKNAATKKKFRAVA